MKRLVLWGVLVLVVPAMYAVVHVRARHRPPPPAMSVPLTPTSGGQGHLVLRSPAVGADGRLPVEFTGDGAGHSPPLEWSGAPVGTQAYTLVMHHLDPEGRTKWYWLLYDLPAQVHSLRAGEHDLGTFGTNSINGETDYAPPHSKGPGPKTYILTIYALSDSTPIALPAAQVTRERLLAAIQGRILAWGRLPVVYSR